MNRAEGVGLSLSKYHRKLQFYEFVKFVAGLFKKMYLCQLITTSCVCDKCYHSLFINRKCFHLEVMC